MSLSVRELKSTSTWIGINEHLSHLNTHQRIEPLLMLVTYLNNPHIRNRTELFIKSGEYEREMDQFYIKFNYTETVHKPESDLIRCCILLHRLLEAKQIKVDEVFPLIDYFKSRLKGSR